jgi:site-specific DNA recombinase
MATTTRAAIYTRVSSPGQEDNYSLPTQEAACRAFAAERGWSIVGVYSDVHTRTELWERTQLSALREAVRHREIDAVICYAIDRLSGDPVHLGVILTEADHAGVYVIFVTEPLDDSPEGQLIRFVRGYAAKVEHEKIKERTMRGRIARVSAGKPPVGPRPTYGYCWADDRDAEGRPVKLRLEENPDTAWVVRRIFHEIAEGASARKVASGLTADRVPTPTGKQHWHVTSIVNMVRHPTYIGEVTAWRWKQEKIKGRGKVQSQRPYEEQVVIPGIAPALVTSGIADAALKRLAMNKQESIRNNRNPEAFLLRGGIARCGYCGSALSAYNGPTQAVYRCNTTARDRHGCPHFAITASLLDDAVWNGVRDRLTQPKVIAAELHRLRDEDPTHGDREAIDRRLAEVSRRQRNLMARLADEDNPDVAALIRTDVAALLDEGRRLEQDRSSLEIQCDSWRLAQERLSELDHWIRNVAANIDAFDYAKKRLALDALGATVRVWSMDHNPRWDVKLHCDVLTTTTGACGIP